MSTWHVQLNLYFKTLSLVFHHQSPKTAGSLPVLQYDGARVTGPEEARVKLATDANLIQKSENCFPTADAGKGQRILLSRLNQKTAPYLSLETN